VVGSLPLPGGWTEIAAVEAAGDTLTIRDASGAFLEVPFDDGFLARH
jgi:hypothetical protein